MFCRASISAPRSLSARETAREPEPVQGLPVLLREGAAARPRGDRVPERLVDEIRLLREQPGPLVVVRREQHVREVIRRRSIAHELPRATFVSPLLVVERRAAIDLDAAVLVRAADAADHNAKARAGSDDDQFPDIDGELILPGVEDRLIGPVRRAVGRRGAPAGNRGGKVLRGLRVVEALHRGAQARLIGPLRPRQHHRRDDEGGNHCNVKLIVIVISTATGWPRSVLGV